ncbi:MAG: adenylate kinase [Candidatus Azobacteroides pseudotrichonymphae]|jgi:adenylate kinase|nr:adenylate kinase [Bacteroidales bacterium OttesenSCG-928-I14]GMO34914.1 MAG: adenylate kinase [Candidatus Azobacteroides pseudotrichonymphae]
MLNIGIFGAPGSGKGTQSELISEKYSLYPISTGEILRREIKDKTELGKIAEEYINQGQLLPDYLTIRILVDLFDKVDNNKGYIFDGFPRTISQAKALDDLLKEQNTSIAIVFSLSVDEKELIRRLLKRGELFSRKDDNLETIQNRLTVYREQTESVQEYYRKKGKLMEIIGENSVEEVFENIVEKIDNLFR